MLPLLRITVTLLLCNIWTTLAGDFTPCKANDFGCQLKSAKAYSAIFAEGVPSIGLTTLDPLHIEKLETSVAGLTTKFSDIDVTGLKQTEIENWQFDTKKDVLKFTIVIASSVMRGDYVLKGRLLVLPIEGNGKFSIFVNRLKSDVTAELVKKTTEDGKDYWQIAKYTFKTDPENMKYEFTNLFNGNKELSDAAHDFANNNFREITSELGGPILDALHKKVIKHINKFLRKTPKEELFVE